jgi:hypothetical protein
VPHNIPEGRLRQLEARVGIQVLSGQGAAAKSECEQTRALLEARIAERGERPDFVDGVGLGLRLPWA